MLKLTRRVGQEIIVGGDTVLRLLQIERPHVKIACVGPGVDGIGTWNRIPNRKTIEGKVVTFGDDIEVKVLKCWSNQACIGLTSRSERSIYRREIWGRILKDQ